MTGRDWARVTEAAFAAALIALLGGAAIAIDHAHRRAAQLRGKP